MQNAEPHPGEISREHGALRLLQITVAADR
jgi:hypothetical protein